MILGCYFRGHAVFQDKKTPGVFKENVSTLQDEWLEAYSWY